MLEVQLDVEHVVEGLDRDGFCVIPSVLSRADIDRATELLWADTEESAKQGNQANLWGEANFALVNLVDFDPFFIELLAHPVSDAVVSRCLGPDYIVSNYGAHLIRPHSDFTMPIHSDQSMICAPEPWNEPWALNMAWCFTDLRFENGATLYLPGSHRVRRRSELPAELDDVKEEMVPFEAPAGSVIALDARLWHTNGLNVTDDDDRPMIFAYYSKPFVRTQSNFPVAISPAVQQRLSPLMRYRLSLGHALNMPRTTADIEALAAD